MSGFNSAVVLTALSLEREAVLEHVEIDDRRKHGRGTLYEVGTLRDIPGFGVAVAEIGAGNHASAIHTERASSFLEPDVIVFVGVAGGLKDVRHGDVVIASKVYGYESGKAEASFHGRPSTYQLAHRVEQHIRQAISDGDWTALLPRERRDNPPNALLKPIVSGEAVIASRDSELFERITREFGDAVAVEMEGLGLFTAGLMNESLPVVDIRGISDLVDDKTPDDDAQRQPEAAANAAALAMSLLTRLAGEPSPLDQGSTDVLAEATGRLPDAYYLNVPRLLADPTALKILADWGPEALTGVKAWSDLNIDESLRLRHLCEQALKSWHAAALPLGDALGSYEVGSRVVFDGPFRTRNWRAYDPQRGLVGDLDSDPHIYTDIGTRRVFMPIEPSWATSTTARLLFNSGSVSIAGVGLLRQVEHDQALVSPYVLAPPTTHVPAGFDALLG